MRLAVIVLVLIGCGDAHTDLQPPHKTAPASDVRMLRFIEGAPVSVEAGGEHAFRLFDEMQRPARGIRVRWSVKPADPHVTIREDGVFVADVTTPEGATYEIDAEVNGGARTLRTAAMVFHPGDNPFLLDTWRETADIGCDGVVRRASGPQRYLRFFSDKTYAYDDGALPPDAPLVPIGTYAYDESSRTIRFTFGNREPRPAATGTWKLTSIGAREQEPWASFPTQRSRLVLKGIPFDTWRNRGRSEPCARVFEASPIVR